MFIHQIYTIDTVLKFLMVSSSSSYSLGPGLDLYAFNLTEDNSTVLG